MGIVRHDNATEQDGHDAREMDALCKEVRTKGKDNPHGKLQGVDSTKVHILQKLEYTES